MQPCEFVFPVLVWLLPVVNGVLLFAVGWLAHTARRAALERHQFYLAVARKLDLTDWR